MPQRRTAHQLSTVRDPAWPGLQRAVEQAGGSARVLPADDGPAALERLQVTAASTLGALALHTGGLLVDHGWLRLLGGGSTGLPALGAVDLDGGLLVGHDVLGSRYAVDGGGLGTDPGEVCVWGVDTLRWDGLGAGHTAFVLWALDGGLDDLVGPFRWPGWQEEVAALRPDQGLSLWPPPFTREGQDAAVVSRRPAPLAELVDFYADTAHQLDGEAP